MRFEAQASEVDKAILRHADTHSAEEISEFLGGGLTAAEVALRRDELLTSRNPLSDAQDRLLLDWRLRQLLMRLEGELFNAENASVQLRVLKEIGAQIEKRQSAAEQDLNKLYGNTGRILGRVVDMAFAYMKGALRDQVDADQWDSLEVEAITQARQEIAKYEVED